MICPLGTGTYLAALETTSGHLSNRESPIAVLCHCPLRVDEHRLTFTRPSQTHQMIGTGNAIIATTIATNVTRVTIVEIIEREKGGDEPSSIFLTPLFMLPMYMTDARI